MFSHTELLRAEINKLDAWLAEQQLHLVYDNILRIRKKFQSALNHSSYLADYLKDALAINAVLANQHDNVAFDTLRSRIEITVGAATPERKALGVAMMVLGVSLLILGMLVITTTLACAFPLAGFFLLFGGGVCFTAGIGFFRSGLQRGMAKELDNLYINHP